MNVEKLIAKGVEKHFDGQKVLFKVASLKEHFEGLQIHDSDILLIEEEAYVRLGDVGFGGATANKIHPKFEEETPSKEFEEIPVWVNPPLEEIVVVSEIVAPEVIVAKTPKKKSKKQ